MCVGNSPGNIKGFTLITVLMNNFTTYLYYTMSTTCRDMPISEEPSIIESLTDTARNLDLRDSAGWISLMGVEDTRSNIEIIKSLIDADCSLNLQDSSDLHAMMLNANTKTVI